MRFQFWLVFLSLFLLDSYLSTDLFAQNFYNDEMRQMDDVGYSTKKSPSFIKILLFLGLVGFGLYKVIKWMSSDSKSEKEEAEKEGCRAYVGKVILGIIVLFGGAKLLPDDSSKGLIGIFAVGTVVFFYWWGNQSWSDSSDENKGNKDEQKNQKEQKRIEVEQEERRQQEERERIEAEQEERSQQQERRRKAEEANAKLEEEFRVAEEEARRQKAEEEYRVAEEEARWRKEMEKSQVANKTTQEQWAKYAEKKKADSTEEDSSLSQDNDNNSFGVKSIIFFLGICLFFFLLNKCEKGDSNKTTISEIEEQEKRPTKSKLLPQSSPNVKTKKTPVDPRWQTHDLADFWVYGTVGDWLQKTIDPIIKLDGYDRLDLDRTPAGLKVDRDKVVAWGYPVKSGIYESIFELSRSNQSNLRLKVVFSISPFEFDAEIHSHVSKENPYLTLKVKNLGKSKLPINCAFTIHSKNKKTALAKCRIKHVDGDKLGAMVISLKNSSKSYFLRDRNVVILSE